MRARLKPLSDQVVVITGASSGIGLATAQLAARRGARVVLSSRNGAELGRIVARIRQEGGDCAYVVADVSQRGALKHLEREATRLYGGFDTWVNNAGVGIFGRLDVGSDEDHRRLFDVSFWGIVVGTQIAAKHLRSKGGAIINLGSVVSDVAFPLQGMYCASKHALKGFTDAFRMEEAQVGSPVSVTLIKPSAIDTPFPRHARNYLDEEPALPPPLYHPEDVAEAILYAAEHGGRDYYVGGGGKLVSTLNKHVPSAFDWVAARATRLETAGRPPTRARAGSLHMAGDDGEERGEPAYRVRRSAYTAAQTHPSATLAILATAVAGAALLARFAGRRKSLRKSGL